MWITQSCSKYIVYKHQHFTVETTLHKTAHHVTTQAPSTQPLTPAHLYPTPIVRAWAATWLSPIPRPHMWGDPWQHAQQPGIQYRQYITTKLTQWPHIWFSFSQYLTFLLNVFSSVCVFISVGKSFQKWVPITEKHDWSNCYAVATHCSPSGHSPCVYFCHKRTEYGWS